MSLAAITLPTNKSMTLVNNNRRTVRQDEKGLSIVVTILDANGADYDLSGKDLEFCERKVSSKVIVDDGTDQDSDKGGKFTPDADHKGTFTYTLPKQAYAASGTCWFTIKQGDSVIDTTKDFYLDVDDEASINLSNDNYASSFEAQLTYYKSLYSKANDTLNADHQQYVDGLNEYKQNFDDLKSQWTKQTSDIQTAANQQIADAKKAASDQLASDTQAAKNQRDSEQQTFTSTLQDQVKQIESARDAAIQQANDDFKAQRDQLASDFANWQKTEHDSLTQTLADIQAHVDQLQNTDLPGMDDKVKDLQAKIVQAEQDAQDATAKFNSIDITKYELKSDLANDYYNKAETDSKLSTAGAVKKVANISPNDDGNVPIKIGGTNLAHGTILDLTGADKNYGNTKKFSFTAPSDSDWDFAAIPLDVSFKKGDIFTISFDSTLTGSQAKDGWIKTTIYNGGYSYCYDDNPDTVWIKAGDRGSKTIVVNADSDPSNPPVALVYAGVAGSTGGNTLTVENFKVERGNVPTDYSLPLGEISTETDITSLQNTVNNIDSTRTPLVKGADGDDLFAFKTNQIRLYNNNGSACKNLPPASNIHYFTVQYVFESPNNDGMAIYRTPDNEIWTVGCNGASYNTGWVRVANSTDITNLMSMQQTLQTTVSSNQTDIATIKNTLKDSMLVKSCTQAQYDAMTDEQKKSAAWMISDS